MKKFFLKLKHNWHLKLLALCLAIVVWIFVVYR